ncbi:uncharacterized protein LOC123676892 [Harmonia axyridis]|uniref:uncharacterized protein LOC123676892 n=1 Tax=Harmonia axyridis TaxID=115357 RepID=UPI001E276EE5|nr:uncharacterized protein LOC123676892 [Harmonia axyridis]
MLKKLCRVIFLIHAVSYELVLAVQKTSLQLESFSVCPENENTRYPIRDLTFNRVNATHSALSLKVSFLDDIGDNIWSQIILERWTSGGWASVPFVTQKNPCKMCLQYFPEIWIGYFRAMGVKEPEKCPIPKGDYVLENYLIPMQGVKIPFWKGRFRVKVLWTGSKDSNDIYYCLEIGASSEEKI